MPTTLAPRLASSPCACSKRAASTEQAQGELAKRGAKVVGISMEMPTTLAPRLASSPCACSVEAARFEQAQGELAKRGAKVVGISMDALEKHEEACAKGGLTFPLLSDASGDVSKAYGADLSI